MKPQGLEICLEYHRKEESEDISVGRQREEGNSKGSYRAGN